MSGRREADRDRGERERERERGEHREKHRERDRDRDTDARRQPTQNQNSIRSNEYFVPRDGIDREVITADICRYLGNDALVRPGNFENPQTRQVLAGYWITAYRNLTTAMIADLKVDSERWETERRAASGSRPINGTVSRDSSGYSRPSNTQSAPQYIGSRTQHEREYYGPSEQSPATQVPQVGGYQPSNSAGPQGQGVYNDYQSSQHQSLPQGQMLPPAGGSYQQPPPGGYPIHQEPQREYLFGAAFANADTRPVDRNAGRGLVTPVGQVPRSDAYSSAGPATTYPPDRNAYNYPSQSSTTSGQYFQQPTDSSYGRPSAASGPQYDTAMMDYSDSRPTYQDPNAYIQPQMPTYSSQSQSASIYSQAPIPSGYPATSSAASNNPPITSGPPNPRREERRRDDRDSRHGHTRR